MTVKAFFVLAGLIVTSLVVLTARPTSATPESFKIKQYKEFHDVLHPLEHDAMPKNDIGAIRAKASDLVRLGNDIIKLGVPRGTNPELFDTFETELENFNRALKAFATEASEGPDDKVKVTFSAVHDSFETLASMLPR